jgi:transcriptional regulator with XRE-family HTH domain
MDKSELAYRDFIREATDSWLLDIEGAKIDFALALNKLMERHSVSRKALAERLGVSLPMITKILRGDTNLTIETMVRATRAANGHLKLELVDEAIITVSESERPRESTVDASQMWARRIARRDQSDAAVHGWVLPKACQSNLIAASNDYEDEPLAA